MKTDKLFSKRKKRVRGSIPRDIARPRLSVYRSNQHISVQVIDDIKNVTLASGSDVLQKAVKKTKTEKAFVVGEEIAKKVLKLKVKEVVFDRGGYKYHGRVKALAEGARKGGLIF